MKVLFVSSANSGQISPLVKSQGESLRKLGLEIEYFGIRGKGIMGYLGNIKSLREKIRRSSYDIIHAHYIYSGILSALAGFRSIVVSLMGSDVEFSLINRLLAKLFSKFFWRIVIVKSHRMYTKLNIKKAIVIPNGVNIEFFKPIDPDTCRKKLGLSEHSRHLLFPGNPDRHEKNFILARKAVDMITGFDVSLHVIHGESREKLLLYYNACHLLILSSLWEGSPNVVKEAMACNCPVVATDVGDIKELLSGSNGNYMVGYESSGMSDAIAKILYDNARSSGRNTIIRNRLDEFSIAKKIYESYQTLM